MSSYKMNPELDLKLERMVDLPAKKIWEAWTNPEILKEWFCPKPWYVSECKIDLRPGGIFQTDMNGPNGEVYPNLGTFLVVEPYKKLVWTDGLLPDFRPNANGFMTGMLELEEVNGKTKYTAYALHKDLAGKQQHIEMGFEQGWGMALDQLIQVMKNR